MLNVSRSTLDSEASNEKQRSKTQKPLNPPAQSTLVTLGNSNFSQTLMTLKTPEMVKGFVAGLRARLGQLYAKIMKLFRINKVLATVLLTAFAACLFFVCKRLVALVRPAAKKLPDVVEQVVERFTD